MALMGSTHLVLAPKTGRPSKVADVGAIGIRSSRSGGQVRLEWRQQDYSLRVYAANKPISYRALNSVANAGALLHIEGVVASQLSKNTSRSASTEHDEQNHLIQRFCALGAFGLTPFVWQWDEGSKRKKAYVTGALSGGREQGDGSRLREVLGARVLKKDASGKKTGSNIARSCLSMLLDFFTDGQPAEGAPLLLPRALASY